MSGRSQSIAMTAEIATALIDHLTRPDGQEDVCLAIYRPSTGSIRTTMLLEEVILPEAGERTVHGNVSFTGDYVVRAAAQAAANGAGIAILHSHPGAVGWQEMSEPDADAERSYAYLVAAMTGHPLVGVTLAGADTSWSGRTWTSDGIASWCESIRVVGAVLETSWNDRLRPPPPRQASQLRTTSGWGHRTQRNLARLRVLIVGLGSVGLEIALRIAATGVEHVGLMDFDGVEEVNLDRLIGATGLDVAVCRSKVELATRLVTDAATAATFDVAAYEWSICEPDGLAVALDYDVIFSCVDRPWPRAVLNALAYSDLIPVLDGGIHIDAFADEGMRNATWRSHVIRPGRPCLACNRQLDLGAVPIDREGLLDDPQYIAAAGTSGPARQNVAALSIGVVSTLLAQFVSLVAAPGGEGEPGPLQYSLSTHTLEHLPAATRDHCSFEAAVAAGDHRLTVTGTHELAQEARCRRRQAQRRPLTRVLRRLDALLLGARRMLCRAATRA